MTDFSIDRFPIISRMLQPTVPLIEQHEMGHFIKACICNPDFFQQSRLLIDASFFSSNNAFASVWTGMCAAYDQHGLWNEEILFHCVTSAADAYHETMLPPNQKGALLQRNDQGFLYLAVHANPSEGDLTLATDIRHRLVYEKLVVNRLRVFLNPGLNVGIPTNVFEALEEIQQIRLEIESSFCPRIESVTESWSQHEQQLEIFRGRSRIGLLTGIESLDQKTMGLRGVTLLGAGPGTGKTALCLQIAKAVCADSRNDNAIAVFISLELSKMDLTTRLKCHLTGSTYRDYMLGQPTADGREFSVEQISQRDTVFAQLSENWGDRLCILDRDSISNKTSVDSILATVRRLKLIKNASKALIILDYLQLLEIPGDVHRKGELECDKYRVRMVQDLNQRSKSESNPFGDAVIAISESRKPTGDARANRIWGAGMADLMGSARLGYAADLILTLKQMSPKEVQEHYPPTEENAASQLLEDKQEQGVAPLLLQIAKGRDGMMRGAVPLEFDFFRSQFHELRHGRRFDPAVRAAPRQRPRLQVNPQQGGSQ